MPVRFSKTIILFAVFGLLNYVERCCFSACPMESLSSYKELKSYIQDTENQITDLNSLIKCLPMSYRSNYTLIESSQSPEKDQITSLTPRVILFGPSGSPILSFTGDPKGSKYEILQILENVDGLRYSPFVINFESHKPHFDESPGECKACHTEKHVPLWAHYPIWKGAYGGFDDTLDIMQGGDAGRKAFATRIIVQNRKLTEFKNQKVGIKIVQKTVADIVGQRKQFYKFKQELLGSSPEYDRYRMLQLFNPKKPRNSSYEEDYFPYLSEHHDSGHHPNERFTFLLFKNRLDGILAEAKRFPSFSKDRYRYLALENNCDFFGLLEGREGRDDACARLQNKLGFTKENMTIEHGLFENVHDIYDKMEYSFDGYGTLKKRIFSLLTQDETWLSSHTPKDSIYEGIPLIYENNIKFYNSVGRSSNKEICNYIRSKLDELELTQDKTCSGGASQSTMLGEKDNNVQNVMKIMQEVQLNLDNSAAKKILMKKSKL